MLPLPPRLYDWIAHAAPWSAAAAAGLTAAAADTVVAGESGSPANLVFSGGLVATLAGCLVWVLKHVLTKTLPEAQKASAEQMDRTVASFERMNAADRATAIRMHEKLASSIEDLAGAVRERLPPSSENGHAPLRPRPAAAPDA